MKRKGVVRRGWGDRIAKAQGALKDSEFARKRLEAERRELRADIRRAEAQERRTEKALKKALALCEDHAHIDHISDAQRQLDKAKAECNRLAKELENANLDIAGAEVQKLDAVKERDLARAEPERQKHDSKVNAEVAHNWQQRFDAVDLDLRAAEDALGEAQALMKEWRTVPFFDDTKKWEEWVKPLRPRIDAFLSLGELKGQGPARILLRELVAAADQAGHYKTPIPVHLTAILESARKLVKEAKTAGQA